jgi:transcriptional antiterminator
LRQKALAVGKGPQEQQIIELIMDNERDFRPYAEILGLSNKSVEEQRREVNQVKEKLRLRLRRSLKNQVRKL